MEDTLKEVAENKAKRIKDHVDDLKEKMVVPPPKEPVPIP
jgi:hypothetical protein